MSPKVQTNKTKRILLHFVKDVEQTGKDPTLTSFQKQNLILRKKKKNK